MRRAGALVVILSSSVGCQWYADREAVRAVVAEAQTRLAQSPEVYGDLASGEGELRLADGALKLSFEVHHDEPSGAGFLHVHALAEVARRPAAPLDFCVFGATPAEVAQILAAHALPPLVSALRGRALLGAERTFRTNRDAVPGRAGFVGPALVRGALEPHALLDRGLFVDMPQVRAATGSTSSS